MNRTDTTGLRRTELMEIPPKETHALIALVEDAPGALNRIVSLFRRRGINLASVNSGPSEQRGITRVSLVMEADGIIANQCAKQLSKLIDVVEVEALSADRSVQREMVLVRVKAPKDHRSEILEIVSVLGGRVAQITPSHLTVEFTGDATQVEAFINTLYHYGVVDVARSGLLTLRNRDLESEWDLAYLNHRCC